MGLRAVRSGLLLSLALPVIVRAQAAVEYAARAGSAAASSGGSRAIAGCPLDSAIASCLSHTYPRASLVIVALLVIVLVRSLVRRNTA